MFTAPISLAGLLQPVEMSESSTNALCDCARCEQPQSDEQKRAVIEDIGAFAGVANVIAQLLRM